MGKKKQATLERLSDLLGGNSQSSQLEYMIGVEKLTQNKLATH
jgi:hypothetical protein